MKKIIFIMFFLTACTSATMVSQPGQSSQFGPSNESSRVGTVKYLNQGADFVINSRREDAYKQMYAACHAKYKITSEGPNSSGGVATPVAGSVYYSSFEYWYINFQCE